MKDPGVSKAYAGIFHAYLRIYPYSFTNEGFLLSKTA